MTFFKDFILRGFTAAWAGPVILAIVYAALNNAGVVSSVTVDKLFTAVISSVVMAFIAGGISCIYKTERLPIAFAAIIHMIVLYFDYLAFYLINGYLATGAVWIFTVIFAAGFLVVWQVIYLVTRQRVKRMNKKING